MNAKVIGQAKLEYDDKTYTMDILEGTEGERAIDIRKLRSDTGFITLDPGYVNTGSCESGITFINGEEGTLRHRGYAIGELADKLSFKRVAYLLIHNKLPTDDEARNYTQLLNEHAMIHEGMRTFFHRFPERAHPMAILSATVQSLNSFYPELECSDEQMDITVTRLMSKVRTLAAYAHKVSVGEPYVYPQYRLNFCENILNMMFYSPVNGYELDPTHVTALNKLLILHADHEQNCSTSVVRMVGSSGANLYASISAGISALWGPLHGGANQKVVEMLQQIHDENIPVQKVVEMAKNKESGFRLMGFGHRVYKAYDPRAKIAKQSCKEVLETLGTKDPLLDIAMELEEAALNDDYFKERNLYPNVDYYTGITYRAMGFPVKMFPVLFAIGRLPGWIAHWLEQRNSSEARIGRPRQVYVGPNVQGEIPQELVSKQVSR